mmetsp:Transcript_152818/g.490198  ORF Transcript_152818/g.490198 Transcript_152818/m.490198 type:complete len:229 (-) Transcript_152818:1015-1701(-)
MAGAHQVEARRSPPRRALLRRRRPRRNAAECASHRAERAAPPPQLQPALEPGRELLEIQRGAAGLRERRQGLLHLLHNHGVNGQAQRHVQVLCELHGFLWHEPAIRVRVVPLEEAAAEGLQKHRRGGERADVGRPELHQVVGPARLVFELLLLHLRLDALGILVVALVRGLLRGILQLFCEPLRELFRTQLAAMAKLRDRLRDVSLGDGIQRQAQAEMQLSRQARHLV